MVVVLTCAELLSFRGCGLLCTTVCRRASLCFVRDNLREYTKPSWTDDSAGTDLSMERSIQKRKHDNIEGDTKIDVRTGWGVVDLEPGWKGIR